MSRPHGESGSGKREPTKGLAAENAALRRTLKREVAQRKRLQKELGQETARRGEAEAALAEAQSHERAASEILRVISGSPTDIRPVFDDVASDPSYTAFPAARAALAMRRCSTCCPTRASSPTAAPSRSTWPAGPPTAPTGSDSR